MQYCQQYTVDACNACACVKSLVVVLFIYVLGRSMTYISQDVKGPCWRPRQAIAATSRPEPYIVVVRANSLPPRERAELERELQQHDHKRLYTACVVRNPVDRLISAWKSKLACGGPHGEANAVKAKELFGTDVSDSKYLIPPLIKGAMVASPDLGKALKGKKCLQFTDAINLLEAFRRQKPNAKKREHYLMKSNMLGNEHLSLQTGLCRLPDGRQGGGSSNLLYADVIPVESLAEPSPEPLRRLSNHLGVNLTEHPFLHVHASTEQRDNSISSIRSSSSSSSSSSRSLPSNERATDAHTTDGVSTDEKILNLLNRIESVYREDVEALARLVQPEYPHSRAAAALKVAGILRHDDGTDSR